MTEPDRELLIPHWIPADERGQIDLSELADADVQLWEECDRLGELLNAHVAAYRAGAKARPTGLCCIFRFATLSVEQAAALAASEERLSNAVLVAYA